MLRSLSLKDFVIVRALDIELGPGFSVLTGETGAGKSILIDALQLALGGRGDASVVRDGAARTDIAATFDAPPSLWGWLEENGFQAEPQPPGGEALILRRSIDNQGRSRAWVNGISATVTQLREAADHLVDFYGQHAWQSLTRPAAVRALLDEHAGVQAGHLNRLWQAWQVAKRQLEMATSHAGERERERERLAWQLAEVDKLAPKPNEWPELNDDHKRLSNAQALIDAAQQACLVISEADVNAEALVGQAADALARMVDVDARLQPALDALLGAQAQLSDASHTLRGYLQRADVDPARLAQLDERMSTWISLSRRLKVAPADLPAQREAWHQALEASLAAGDLQALTAAEKVAEQAFMNEAQLVSKARKLAAPELSAEVTKAMQHLGMGGGSFAVQLQALDTPQSFGLESVELLVAGHAGATLRPVAKVASGGELSRLALAVAVTGCRRMAQRQTLAAKSPGSAKSHNTQAQDRADSLVPNPHTLIFDEIDAGVGGAVAISVAQLMRELGRNRQVLAVTHLAQVAAHANAHWLVTKGPEGVADLARGQHRDAKAVTTQSDVRLLEKTQDRLNELARMIGGSPVGVALAHARDMLTRASADSAPTSPPTKVSPKSAGKSRKAA